MVPPITRSAGIESRWSAPVPVIVYAASAWGVVFALVHVYWVLGGRLGLPSDQSIYDNTPLLVIDIIAIPLCLIAAALPLAIVHGWWARIPERWLYRAMWATAALFVIHAIPSIVEVVAMALGLISREMTTEEKYVMFLYEPWFLLGGILFTLAAHRLREAHWQRRGSA